MISSNTYIDSSSLYKSNKFKVKQKFAKNAEFCGKTIGRNESVRIPLPTYTTKVGPFGIFTHPFCCKISKKLEGDPLEKKNLEKKVSQCRKTERGTLWDFSTYILLQNIKETGGGPFEEKKILEKSLTMPKNWKGGPFGIFKHPFCCKTSKKLERDPLERKKIYKKVSMPKNWKGGPFGIFKHPFCCKISKKLEGDPLEKKILEKKSHNAEKLKGGTLWDFSTSILLQKIKETGGGPFGEKKILEKSLTMPKNWKGEPFGIFKHPFCCKISKKLEGDPLERKKF